MNKCAWFKTLLLNKVMAKVHGRKHIFGCNEKDYEKF